MEIPPSGSARINPPTVIPTVAFWIPLSIETVVALLASRLRNSALLYPIASIKTASIITAGPSFPILSIKVSHSVAIAARTIMTNSPVATILTPLSILSAVSAEKCRTAMPRPTGIVVKRNIVIPRPRMSMSGASAPMKWSIEKPTIRGKVITVTTLTTAV